MAALNCQKEHVYQQMRRTKEIFGKTGQRQGYHLIISFAEGEVDAQTAFEIIGRFAEEYLGKDYEALYAVHDNTEHIHGHIIFNSVSFRSGMKYRYEKGDWAEKIQPVTNRLCEEYGLSVIEAAESRADPGGSYREWDGFRDGKFVWADMVKRDIDACILQAEDYESFLSMLSEMGYGIKNADRKEGKYLALKPAGMKRFLRCRRLGDDYTEERIRERIRKESLSEYHAVFKNTPQIVRCRVKRYRKAALSGLQKKYFARLYRTGQLKKRPYSQAWRYRDDIRKMKKLQEDYLFLVRHDIHTADDLAAAADHMQEKKNQVSMEKSRVSRKRAGMKPLFDAADEMKSLQECENCYRRGETFFESEHRRWQELDAWLKKEGYSMDSLDALKQHYRHEAALVREKEKAAAGEQRTAERILKDLLSGQEGKETDQKRKQEETRKKQEKLQQPFR